MTKIPVLSPVDPFQNGMRLESVVGEVLRRFSKIVIF